MTTIPIGALHAILGYLDDSERSDYEKSDAARRDKHVYEAALQVRAWLDEVAPNILSAG